VVVERHRLLVAALGRQRLRGWDVRARGRADDYNEARGYPGRTATPAHLETLSDIPDAHKVRANSF
jgi:hypothetical protein